MSRLVVRLFNPAFEFFLLCRIPRFFKTACETMAEGAMSSALQIVNLREVASRNAYNFDKCKL